MKERSHFLLIDLHFGEHWIYHLPSARRVYDLFYVSALANYASVYIHGGDVGKGASFPDLLLEENYVVWLPLCERSYAVTSTNQKT